MATKSKYNELTVLQKLKVIYKVTKKVKSKPEIAKGYSILPSTLSTYQKNQDSIEKMAMESDETAMKKRI